MWGTERAAGNRLAGGMQSKKQKYVLIPLGASEEHRLDVSRSKLKRRSMNNPIINMQGTLMWSTDELA